MRRHGFTLIELLVVIAIVALLVAIALPALSAARGSARQAACGSNLHQLAISATNYLHDGDDWFWRYRRLEPAGARWWFGFEAGGPGAGTGRPLDKAQSVLARYQSTLDDEFNCPAFPYADPLFLAKFERRGASYGYNLGLGPLSESARPKRLYDLRGRDSEVFVFADGVHYDFGATFNEGHYLAYAAGASSPSGYAHFRHGGAALVQFADGHVAPQRLIGPTFRVTAGHPSGNLADADGGKRIYGP